MTEEIGTMAGAIWRVLEDKGQMTMPKLKKELKAKSPLFDWGIGWLAREDKIDFTRENRALHVSLKGWRASATHAA